MSTEKEIEEMANNHALQFDNEVDQGWAKYSFKDGFTAGQKLLMEECAEGFKEWMKSEDRHDGVFGNNNNFSRDEWIAENTWQAASLAAEKKHQSQNTLLFSVIEEMKEALEFYSKNCRDDLHFQILNTAATDKVARSTLASVEEKIRGTK
jgi:hypothetical protein